MYKYTYTCVVYVRVFTTERERERIWEYKLDIRFAHRSHWLIQAVSHRRWKRIKSQPYSRKLWSQCKTFSFVSYVRTYRISHSTWKSTQMVCRRNEWVTGHTPPYIPNDILIKWFEIASVLSPVVYLFIYLFTALKNASAIQIPKLWASYT